MRLVGNNDYALELERKAKRHGEDVLLTYPLRRMPAEGTFCGDSRSVKTMLSDIASYERADEMAERIMQGLV